MKVVGGRLGKGNHFNWRRGFTVGLLAAAMGTASAAALMAGARPAMAQEVISFDIPQQDLNAALLDFANRAGLQLVYEVSFVEGLRNAPLNGSFTSEEALRRLLAGTGISFRFTGVSTVALQRAADQSDGGPVQLAPITVEAVLEGTLTESYGAPDSFSATRTDTPLIETPQSAQSITRQALEDAGAQNLADAYDYLAGISRDNTQGGLQGDEYLARGFETDNVLFNGNRTSSASTLDTANVERVEALRGPTAALFGKADPGGLVNVITKQPLSDPFYEIDVSGSAGLGGDGDRLRQGRTTFDLGGPLSEDGQLRYRFNGAVEYERSYRQDVDERLLFLAPVFDYSFDEKTAVNVEFAYQHREDTFDRGVFFVNDELILPVDFNLAEGNTGQIDKDYASGTIRLQHEFATNWTARLGIYASNDIREGDSVQQGGVTGSIALRQRRDVEAKDRFLTLQPEITGEFETGAIGHTLLVGADIQHEKQSFYGLVGPRGGAIDVFNPDFSVPVPDIDPTLSTPGTAMFDAELEGESVGIYLQDQIDLTDEWKLLLGARLDRVDIDSDNTTAFNVGSVVTIQSESNFKDTNISPRVGIVYQPVSFASIYGSYSESYRPPTSSFGFSDSSGAAVDAETAKNYEVGVKLEALEGRLNGTFALYRADKENVLESDPTDPFGLSVINLGKVRGQGVEFDLSGEITENLSLGVSYAFTDTRTASSTPTLPSGTRLRNVPKHAGSLQLAYRFTEGPFDGLRLFGSAFYEDEKFTDTSATIRNELPSFVRFNVGAQYEILPNVTASFFVENLTDVEYYTSAAGRLNVEPGDPRRFQLGLRARF